MSDRLTFAAKIEPDGRRLKGSVQLAGSRTFRDGEWVQIDPNALMKANADDVIATVDHDPSKVMGRTKNNTLSLSRTDQGIEFSTADLPNTTAASDALELARGGYFGGSSFTIEGMRSKFSTDPDGTRVRTITSIKRLADVSLVIDPAFANSTAAAFSKEQDMDEDKKPAPQPEPPDEPAAKFSEQASGKDGWAAFAKGKPVEHLQTVMDNLMEEAGGNLKGIALEQYEGFAQELDRRSREDAETAQRAKNMAAFHALRMGRAPKAPQPNEALASDDYAQAFNKYLRTGKSADLESFAQSIAGSGAEGGFTVPDGFLNRITQRLKAFGGIAGVADEITTSTGESLRWPSNDDTGNSAAIAAEGVAGTAGADLVFGSIELGAFSYDANGASNAPLKVSLELIQDSAFDIAAFVGDKLGERIGRKQAVHLATGVGGTEPVGLLSKSADTMTATVASLAASEHIFQVDSAYRDLGNCRFVMSDTTLVKFWQAQASGVPIFIPGGASIGGAPHGTLYGYPITIDPAAGNLVAFGDIRKGYIIRRVRGVQVLVDPYTAQSTRQIAYHAWARMDANIQDSFAYSVSTYASVSADT